VQDDRPNTRTVSEPSACANTTKYPAGISCAGFANMTSLSGVNRFDILQICHEAG